MSKSLKTIAALSVFLLFQTSVQAQTQQTLLNHHALPSPTVSGLVSNLSVQPDIFSGRLNASIPLIEMQSGDLGISLNLNYDINSIKVSEPVGWLGTGWDVSVGGVVTRVLKGNPDEVTDGYFNTGDSPDYLDFLNELETGIFTVDGGVFIRDDLETYYDTAPDIFHYNVQGYTGSFVIPPGTNGNNVPVEQLNKSNVLIEASVSTGSINYFKITAPDGTIYHFGNLSHNSNSQEEIDSNNPQISDYTSSWMLTRIESGNSDRVINYSYTSEGLYKIYHYGYEAKFEDILGGAVPDDQVSNPNIVTYKKKLLDKIIFDDVEIDFKHYENGTDANFYAQYAVPRFQLNRIDINKSNSLFKAFKFNYQIPVGTNRQYLESIDKLGEDDIVYEKFKMEYYNWGDLPGDRSSKAVDIWGFYNGKPNTSYLPGLYVNLTETNFDRYYVGADRSVNTGTVYYGALKKIVLPTGGSQEFEYEPNTYSRVLFPNLKVEKRTRSFNESGNGTLNLQTKAGDGNDYAKLTFDVDYHFQNLQGPNFDIAGIYLNGDKIFGPSSSTTPVTGTYNFSVDNVVEGQHTIEIKEATGTNSISYALSVEDYILVEEESGLSELTVDTYSFLTDGTFSASDSKYDLVYLKIVARVDLDPSNSSDGIWLNGQKLTSFDLGVPVNLTNHVVYEDYVTEGNFDLDVRYSQDEFIKADVTVAYHDAKDFKHGPGLRVTKVTTSDSDPDTPDVIEKYEYGSGNNSWGFVVNEPKFDFIFPSKGAYNSIQNINHCPQRTFGCYETQQSAFLGRTATPTQSLGGDMRGFMGYSKVKKILGNSGEFGNVEYTFSSSVEQSESVTFEDYENAKVTNSDIFPEGANVSFRLGKLLSTSVFDDQGTLISRDRTKHKFYDTSAFENNGLVFNRIKGIGLMNFSTGAKLFGLDYQYSVYSNLDYQTKAIYEGASSDSVYVKTDFQNYDLTFKQFATKVETDENTQKSRTTEYVYAHSIYNSAGQMRDKNMLNQLYSVELKDSAGSPISKSWTTWANNLVSGHSDRWFPKATWMWNGSGTISNPPTDAGGSPNAVKTSEVTSYDIFGNPLVVKDANDNTTNVFYGSNEFPFQNAISNSGAVNDVRGVYLTGIQRIQNGADPTTCSSDDICTSAMYDEYGRLVSITDENGDTSEFGYDPFSRLGLQTNQKGNVISTNSYTYSVDVNSGTFSATSPNFIESISYTTIDGFKEPTSAGGMSKWGDSDYNVTIDGEQAMRVGFDGSWDGFRRYFYWTQGIAKADIYIDPGVTTGSAHPFYIMTSNGHEVLTVRYSATETNFTGRIKHGNVWQSPVDLGIPAEKGKWYTVEIEKSHDGTCGYLYVYPRGSGRDYSKEFSACGYPSGWNTRIQSSGGLNGDGYYVANMYRGEIQKTISVVDGLGRDIQSQQRAGNTVILNETLYDERGLPEVVSRPIEETATGSFAYSPGNYYYDSGLLGGTQFTIGSAIPASAPVYQYQSTVINNSVANSQYAYSQTKYEDNPLSRVEKTTLPGTSLQMGSNNEVTVHYSLNNTESFVVDGFTWDPHELTKSVSVDPENKETITYTDSWGRTIVSGVNMNPGTGTGEDQALIESTNDLITKFVYDERDNLIKSIDPRGLVTTYNYNELGQLESKKLPDQTHNHTYRYDKKGRLRFHRDPNLDAASDHYYYTKYDDLDRPVEVGKRNSSAGFDVTSDINSETFPTSSYTWYVKYSYDGVNAATGAANTKGNLTRIEYDDPNSANSGFTWYSYNDLGLVEWVIQRPPGFAQDIKIEYTYDEVSRLTRVFYNPPGNYDDHYFYYFYDELGRLSKITSSANGEPSNELTEAEYTYFADGQVEQLILGDGAQQVDYDYTVQGWLGAINGGAIASGDKFGMSLMYDNTGNIEKQNWAQAGATITNTLTYDYTYDLANRLTTAAFNDPNGTLDNNNGFDGSFTFDKSGNLKSLIRRAGTTGNAYKSVPSITYATNSNRITGISYENWPSSATSQNVTYDANGNIRSNSIQGIITINYDWRNLPKEIETGNSILKYTYDAEGKRVKKIADTIVTTTYIRGADGQTIAAYDGSGNMMFLNILSGGQIIGQIEN